jgi:hypothetical protein
MTKSDSEHRIGLYECKIGPDRHVVPGESLKKLYYERFTQDLVKSTIIPDLKRRGGYFEFPVLVVSWRLYPRIPDRLSIPKYKLIVSKPRNLREVRKALGISPQREIVPGSRTYRVVIDEQGNIFPVDSNDKTFLPTWPRRD